MLNPVWLKTFCTLVDIGHFTQTSEHLYMTQSGVSQHIKKLEQQLATQLLIRSGKSFSLTEAGAKLYQEGKLLLNTMQVLESSIKQDEPHSGKVVIASPGSVGLKLYPYLLNIQQQYPELAIDYRFAPNKDIEESLASKKIDIGLITQRSKLKDVVCDKTSLEPLVLVTAIDIDSVNWQKLLSLGFISHPDSAHHAHLLLSKNFAEFKHTDQFIQKGFSNQVGLILEPVSRGLGFTVLPLHAVNAFHKKAHIRIHTLSQSVSESLYICKNSLCFESKRITYITSVIRQFLIEETINI